MTEGGFLEGRRLKVIYEVLVLVSRGRYLLSVSQTDLYTKEVEIRVEWIRLSTFS